jgi:hypothetical protein
MWISSGFCVNFKICTGDDLAGDSAKEDAVAQSTEPILYKWYMLYLEDWYSSPQVVYRTTGSKKRFTKI